MTEFGTCFFTNHSLSASVRGWTDLLKRDSPAYPHDSQIIEESGPNEGSGGGSTPHNESFQPPSTSPGREGVPPPSTKDSTYVNTADADTPESSCHGQVSMIATSGRSHLEGASPTGPGEKPGQPPFECADCHTRFTQTQVLKRHHREKHQPHLNCWHPECDDKWTQSRSSEYRIHLKKKHSLEDGNINEILGGPPRRRRRTEGVIECHLPPHTSPPPIEHDRQSLAEPQQRPLMSPLLAVGKDAHHASPPLIPSVSHNPLPGHAEPAITTTKHEDSSSLEHLAATHAPSKLFSEEDSAMLAKYVKDSIRNNGRIRFPVSVDPMVHSQTLIYTPVVDCYEIGTKTVAASDGYASTLTNGSSWLGPVGDLELYQTVFPD